MEHLIPSRLRNTFNDLGLLILRLWFGGAMLFAHGMPKLQTFSEKANLFPDPLGLGSQLSLVLAIGAEVGCALLLMLGLATRLVSVPLVFTMAVAAFVVHGDDPFSKQEFALMYGFAYLGLFFTGPGRFSLDQLISRKKGARHS
ncbi:DoxX family protein [Lujinxingia litoralis]|uniref:DoxX family protein n=1 Tax=Lujinxingia litoralis TaxID=2211119 RepID=A0A328CAW0_9DELT|nr:DoxX family protein [Lujinxingia litoralis]RAL25312.1 DoxX family protein [Lujinxingia litoralis]